MISIASLKSLLVSRIRKPILIGLDLGGAWTKMIRLEKGTENRPSSLSSYLYPEKVVEADPLSVARFKDYLKENRLTGMEVACNLEDPSLKIRRVDLPKMPDFDLVEAVKWQLRDFTESSIDLYVVRYTLLQEYQMGDSVRLALQVFAVRKDVVQGLVGLLRRLSLKPVLIEPSAVALLGALDQVVSWSQGQRCGILDLGETHSGFLTAGEGRLFFSRPLPEVSGQVLTQIFSHELGLSETEIRSLKEKILPQSPTFFADERIQPILAAFYSRIAVETQRSLDAFSLLFGQSHIDQIYLCGGWSVLPGLSDYLTKNIGTHASLLDPLVDRGGEAGNHHLYAVAMGLASSRQ